MPSSATRKPRLIAAAAVLAASSMFGLAVAPATPATASEVRQITLPIHPDRVDDVHWSDSWGAARSGGRSHIGVDMMGPKMVPLLAVKSGTVTWGRFNNDRGSILRFRDDDGWEYQYIHLNNDSPGTDDGAASCSETFSPRICATVTGDRLAQGTRVTEGEVIGYLGDGGNAEHTAPHLHFEIYRPSNGGVTPVNPTPIVNAALDRLQRGAGPTSEPDPADPGDSGFTDYLWYQVHGRYPTPAEESSFEQSAAAKGLWQAVADQVGPDSTAAAIDRLYLAFFLRYPDSDGIRYWIRVRGSGHSAEDIAEWFAESDEFTYRYGGVGFEGFLDQLYLDVLGRSPDAEGKRYWLGLLERGEVSRGTIVVYFADGQEMRDLSGHRNEIVAVSLLANGETPSLQDVEGWDELRSSTPIKDALAHWYTRA